MGISSKLPGLINQYTLDDQQLQRVHAIYVARKITEAASLGKLSAQMITEELANQLSSTSSNGLIKSAATNTDSALVPDCDFSSANVMSPATGAGGLEGGVVLSGNNKASQNRTNTSVNHFPFAQLLF